MNFNGMGNLQNIMRQAQKMQEDMKKSREEIDSMEFVGTSGGGMVSVNALGSKKINKVTINPQVVDADDIEMLEDLIAAAVNDVINQITNTEKEKLPQMPAGM